MTTVSTSIPMERRFHRSSESIVMALCDQLSDSTEGNAVQNFKVIDREENYFTISIYFSGIEAATRFFHQLGAAQARKPVFEKELSAELSRKASQIVFNLINEGYTVEKAGNRFRASKKYYNGTWIRLEIIDEWCSQKGWFIGRVDTFSSRGQWLQKPIPASEFELKSYDY